MMNSPINIVSPVSKIKAQYLNEDKLITTDEVIYIGLLLDAGVEFGDTFDVESKPINMGIFGWVIAGGYFGVVSNF